MHKYNVFSCFYPLALKGRHRLQECENKRAQSEFGTIIMKCMSSSEIKKLYISLSIVSNSQNGG
jgi:hypothetical protein